MRRFGWFLAVSAALPLALVAYMYLLAASDPVVRKVTVEMPDWPAGAKPLRIALLSDIHFAGPDMPPSRLARIVEQVNALEPDTVLLAGDFVSDKRPATRYYASNEALGSLSKLRASNGVFAVLGNHDHWRSAAEVSEGLRRANVRLLVNEAVTAGGMRLGGVDDDFTGHADVRATITAMRGGRGSKVLLTHSPDVVPRTPGAVTLVLAGHTHCGQIRLPFYGPITSVTRYGSRFECGLIRDGPHRVVVTAGVGTSVLPLRLDAPPDIWLIALGPANA